MERVIVSRHPATVAWIGSQIHPGWHPPVPEEGRLVWRPFGLEPEDPEFNTIYDSVPVLASAGPEDVRGKIVYGNLPLHLACLAAHVGAVEFAGAPPRGQEYTAEDMARAGARLRWYKVWGGWGRPRETYRVAQGCATPEVGERDGVAGGTVIEAVPPSDCVDGRYVVELDA